MIQKENSELNKTSKLLLICSTLFCVCLITSNVLETKQMQVDCSIFGCSISLGLTGGLLVFPISYILSDCIAEVWGLKIARMVIWLGFAMNIVFLLFGALADIIPGASYWTLQEGFHAIFGLAPRITAASLIAFLAGSFINAYVMVKMRDWAKTKDAESKLSGKFQFRAILSTLLGETTDSLIFFPIALGGVVPLKSLLLIMLTQVILKTMYEVLALPFTVRLVKYLKRNT